jgi:hypothetical protein
MGFHQHVELLVDCCEVLLAVIGRRWTSIAEPTGIAGSTTSSAR